MTLSFDKYDVEAYFIAEREDLGDAVRGFRMVKRGMRHTFKCKRCGSIVHTQFTPVGTLPPLLDNDAVPDYQCENCGT